MGLFSSLFEPKDFEGKIEKLFNYYKNNTKIVSMGFIKNPRALAEAVTGIATVLSTNKEQLSYDTIKNYGDLFVTVLSRSASASFLHSDGLIERTAEVLLERYPFVRTKNNAEEISKKLFELV